MGNNEVKEKLEFYVVIFHLNSNDSSIRSFSKKPNSQKLYIFQLPGIIISILNTE